MYAPHSKFIKSAIAVAVGTVLFSQAAANKIIVVSEKTGTQYEAQEIGEEPGVYLTTEDFPFLRELKELAGVSIDPGPKQLEDEVVFDLVYTNNDDSKKVVLMSIMRDANGRIEITQNSHYAEKIKTYIESEDPVQQPFTRLYEPDEQKKLIAFLQQALPDLTEGEDISILKVHPEVEESPSDSAFVYNRKTLADIFFEATWNSEQISSYLEAKTLRLSTQVIPKYSYAETPEEVLTELQIPKIYSSITDTAEGTTTGFYLRQKVLSFKDGSGFKVSSQQAGVLENYISEQILQELKYYADKGISPPEEYLDRLDAQLLSIEWLKFNAARKNENLLIKDDIETSFNLIRSMRKDFVLYLYKNAIDPDNPDSPLKQIGQYLDNQSESFQSDHTRYKIIGLRKGASDFENSIRIRLLQTYYPLTGVYKPSEETVYLLKTQLTKNTNNLNELYTLIKDREETIETLEVENTMLESQLKEDQNQINKKNEEITLLIEEEKTLLEEILKLSFDDQLNENSILTKELQKKFGKTKEDLYRKKDQLFKLNLELEEFKKTAFNNDESKQISTKEFNKLHHKIIEYRCEFDDLIAAIENTIDKLIENNKNTDKSKKIKINTYRQRLLKKHSTADFEGNHQLEAETDIDQGDGDGTGADSSEENSPEKRTKPFQIKLDQEIKKSQRARLTELYRQQKLSHYAVKSQVSQLKESLLNAHTDHKVAIDTLNEIMADEIAAQQQSDTPAQDEQDEVTTGVDGQSEGAADEKPQSAMAKEPDKPVVKEDLEEEPTVTDDQLDRAKPAAQLQEEANVADDDTMVLKTRRIKAQTVVDESEKRIDQLTEELKEADELFSNTREAMKQLSAIDYFFDQGIEHGDIATDPKILKLYIDTLNPRLVNRLASIIDYLPEMTDLEIISAIADMKEWLNNEDAPHSHDIKPTIKWFEEEVVNAPESIKKMEVLKSYTLYHDVRAMPVEISDTLTSDLVKEIRSSKTNFIESMEFYQDDPEEYISLWNHHRHTFISLTDTTIPKLVVPNYAKTIIERLGYSRIIKDSDAENIIQRLMIIKSITTRNSVDRYAFIPYYTATYSDDHLDIDNTAPYAEGAKKLFDMGVKPADLEALFDLNEQALPDFMNSKDLVIASLFYYIPSMARPFSALDINDPRVTYALHSELDEIAQDKDDLDPISRRLLDLAIESKDNTEVIKYLSQIIKLDKLLVSQQQLWHHIDGVKRSLVLMPLDDSEAVIEDDNPHRILSFLGSRRAILNAGFAKDYKASLSALRQLPDTIEHLEPPINELARYLGNPKDVPTLSETEINALAESGEWLAKHPHHQKALLTFFPEEARKGLETVFSAIHPQQQPGIISQFFWGKEDSIEKRFFSSLAQAYRTETTYDSVRAGQRDLKQVQIILEQVNKVVETSDAMAADISTLRETLAAKGGIDDFYGEIIKILSDEEEIPSMTPSQTEAIKYLQASTGIFSKQTEAVDYLENISKPLSKDNKAYLYFMLRWGQDDEDINAFAAGNRELLNNALQNRIPRTGRLTLDSLQKTVDANSIADLAGKLSTKDKASIEALAEEARKVLNPFAQDDEIIGRYIDRQLGINTSQAITTKTAQLMAQNVKILNALERHIISGAIIEEDLLELLTPQGIATEQARLLAVSQKELDEFNKYLIEQEELNGLISELRSAARNPDKTFKYAIQDSRWNLFNVWKSMILERMLDAMTFYPVHENIRAFEEMLYNMPLLGDTTRSLIEYTRLKQLFDMLATHEADLIVDPVTGLLGAGYQVFRFATTTLGQTRFAASQGSAIATIYSLENLITGFFFDLAVQKGVLTARMYDFMRYLDPVTRIQAALEGELKKLDVIKGLMLRRGGSDKMLESNQEDIKTLIKNLDINNPEWQNSIDPAYKFLKEHNYPDVVSLNWWVRLAKSPETYRVKRKLIQKRMANLGSHLAAGAIPATLAYRKGWANILQWAVKPAARALPNQKNIKLLKSAHPRIYSFLATAVGAPLVYSTPWNAALFYSLAYAGYDILGNKGQHTATLLNQTYNGLSTIGETLYFYIPGEIKEFLPSTEYLRATAYRWLPDTASITEPVYSYPSPPDQSYRANHRKQGLIDLAGYLMRPAYEQLSIELGAYDRHQQAEVSYAPTSVSTAKPSITEPPVHPIETPAIKPSAHTVKTPTTEPPAKSAKPRVVSPESVNIRATGNSRRIAAETKVNRALDEL